MIHLATKLTYIFHNPNTEKETIDMILRVCIEANMSKLDQLVNERYEEKAEEEEELHS